MGSQCFFQVLVLEQMGRFKNMFWYTKYKIVRFLRYLIYAFYNLNNNLKVIMMVNIRF